MNSDVVIHAEGLGKKYIIGHQTERERYVALRDVLARTAKGAFRRTLDTIRGSVAAPRTTTEEFWALKDVNFELKRGEVLGIIGRNGAGKSTLLKILSRITEPTTGSVSIRGRVASLLEVGTGFHPELTGRENIYLNGAILGMTRAEIKQKFDEIVAFAEIERFLDTPVKRYSSGMYVRLAFAVAAHLEPEILVVDEVLAVGDAEFQKKCLGKMDEVAGHGRTVLFVSHNMQTLSALCGRGIVLVDGRLVADSTMDGAIAAYTKQIATKKSALPHILYESAGLRGSEEASIMRVEMLDSRLNPKVVVTSRDTVVFRIWIRSRSPLPQGSVVLSIRTTAGSTLAKFETNPRRIQPLRHSGDHYVDCHIDSLPLMPNQYFVSVGLAHYGVRLIDWKVDIGTIVVLEPSDPAYEMSGHPEGSMVIDHRWVGEVFAHAPEHNQAARSD